MPTKASFDQQKNTDGTGKTVLKISERRRDEAEVGLKSGVYTLVCRFPAPHY